MIEALKFVQGAVARKDLVPALTHFRIENGHVRGFNGSIALSSPIAFNLSCSPKAAPFVKAIQTCDETIQLSLTANNKLAITSGGFTVYIECLDTNDFPNIAPEGECIPLEPQFIDVVKRLNPFIAEDASRPWARGIMVTGSSAFATNNIIFVEQWIGSEVPFRVNIPKDTVQELVRIGTAPSHIQVAESSVSFLYNDGRWLRSQLLTTEWPSIGGLLDIPAKVTPTPENFFESLRKLVPFTDDSNRVYLLGDLVSTTREEGMGARVKLPGTPNQGCFNLQQLLLLDGVAEQIDFSAYPQPCLFYGQNIRGVILGQRS
jgi:DNA polymerase III sliding clamp (beta) subunit (PCNA family)